MIATTARPLGLCLRYRTNECGWRWFYVRCPAGRLFGSLHGLSVCRRVYRSRRTTYGRSVRNWGAGLVRITEPQP